MSPEEIEKNWGNLFKSDIKPVLSGDPLDNWGSLFRISNKKEESKHFGEYFKTEKIFRKKLPDFSHCHYDNYLKNGFPDIPSFEERLAAANGKKISFLNLYRKPDKKEWGKLQEWRKNPENKDFVRKVGERSPDFPNRTFYEYHKACINGERWAYDEGYFEPPRKRRGTEFVRSVPDDRVSFFDLGRAPDDKEWEILNEWKRKYPWLIWNRGDVHPLDNSFIFKNYSNQELNGELWLSRESYEASEAIREKYIKEYDAPSKGKRNRSRPENPKTYSQLDKRRERERNRERSEADPVFRLKTQARRLVSAAFRRVELNKNGRSSESILGISYEGFFNHIVSQFEPWMTLENKNPGGQSVTFPKMFWDIDHIVPLSLAETEEDVILLNHYTNLRPFCSYENIIKGDTYPYKGLY